jgi:WD40 repeat protein
MLAKMHPDDDSQDGPYNQSSDTRVCEYNLTRCVKLFNFAGATREFESNVVRFTLPVRALAYSADGAFLAAGGEDSTVKVIKMADRSVAHELATRSKCTKSIAFDPKGDYLSAVDDTAGLHSLPGVRLVTWTCPSSHTTSSVNPLQTIMAVSNRCFDCKVTWCEKWYPYDTVGRCTLNQVDP